MTATFRLIKLCAIYGTISLFLIACSRSQDIGNPQSEAPVVAADCPANFQDLDFLSALSVFGNVQGGTTVSAIPVIQRGSGEEGYNPNEVNYDVTLPRNLLSFQINAAPVLTSNDGDVTRIVSSFETVRFFDNEFPGDDSLDQVAVREDIESESGVTNTIAHFPDLGVEGRELGSEESFLDTRVVGVFINITASVRNSVIYRTCTPEGLSGDGISEVDVVLALGIGSSNRRIVSPGNLPPSGLNAELGRSVAISGNTMVVGAPGVSNGDPIFSGVNQIIETDGILFLDSGEPLSDLLANTTKPDSGLVYVYERQDDDWILDQIIRHDSSDPGDRFGAKVAIEGDIIAISAPGEDSIANGINGVETNNIAEDSGAVFVYERSESSPLWQKAAYIKPQSNVTGVDFFEDDFGFDIAINGNELAIGAPREDFVRDADTIGSTGEVTLYSNESGDWVFLESIRPSLTQEDNLFGYSVDFDADALVIGAPGDASDALGVVSGNELSTWFLESENNFELDTPDSGAVYYYFRDGNLWTLDAYIKAPNADEGDEFGASVAINELRGFIVGAPREDGSGFGLNRNMFSDGAENSGAVYSYEAADAATGSTTAYNFLDYIKPPQPEAGSFYGESLAIDRELIVVGAPGYPNAGVGAGEDTGLVQVYSLISNEDVIDNLVLTDEFFLFDFFQTGEEEIGASVDTSAGVVVSGAPNFSFVTFDENGLPESTFTSNGGIGVTY